MSQTKSTNSNNPDSSPVDNPPSAMLVAKFSQLKLHIYAFLEDMMRYQLQECYLTNDSFWKNMTQFRKEYAPIV